METLEKWLIDRINEKLEVAEEADTISQEVFDELYTLVAATRVLGFSGAHSSLQSRLAELKKKHA